MASKRIDVKRLACHFPQSHATQDSEEDCDIREQPQYANSNLMFYVCFKCYTYTIFYAIKAYSVSIINIHAKYGTVLYAPYCASLKTPDLTYGGS